MLEAQKSICIVCKRTLIETESERQNGRESELNIHVDTHIYKNEQQVEEMTR